MHDVDIDVDVESLVTIVPVSFQKVDESEQRSSLAGDFSVIDKVVDVESSKISANQSVAEVSKVYKEIEWTYLKQN